MDKLTVELPRGVPLYCPYCDDSINGDTDRGFTFGSTVTRALE